MAQTEIPFPRKVAHLGAMIEKMGESKFMSVARATNFRCPEHILAEVDAMGELAGKSRNAMLVYLIEAAIEEVRSTLDDDTILKLNEGTNMRLSRYLADSSVEGGRVNFNDQEGS